MFTKPNKTDKHTANDEVMTKIEIAKLIIEYFNPSGLVLEPCSISLPITKSI